MNKPATDTVKRGTVPAWFRKRLIRAFGPDPHSGSGVAALDHAALAINCDLGSDRYRWLDHWGTATDGSLAFVSEPYWQSFNPKAREAAEQLAAATGCELVVETDGTWNAGTLRLLWLPIGNTPPYAACTDCQAGMTPSQLRRQTVRCMVRGMAYQQATEAMPRCQKCTTRYLADREASR